MQTTMWPEWSEVASCRDQRKASATNGPGAEINDPGTRRLNPGIAAAGAFLMVSMTEKNSGASSHFCRMIVVLLAQFKILGRGLIL